MKVLGIGHVLPKPMRLAEADHPNTLQLEAIRLAGYDKYWVNDDSARAMGTRAVVAALKESGYGVDDIGFIVAGQSNIPDFIGIDFACQVGAELGGLKARTINLVEGCGSSISTWFSANSLVRHLKEGQVGVIVLAQRVSEPHLDRFGIMNAILSDGAVAAIVAGTDAPSSGCGFVYKGGHDISDTRFVDMMRFERGGGVGPVLAENHDSRQDKLGRDRIMELYRFSGSDLTAFLKLRTENTIQIIELCLAEAGWGKDSDLTLLHTLEGRQSMENLASRLGIAKEKTNVDLVAEISHMGCVDQLISLDIMRKQGRIQPGGRVAMSAISSGMKWGCCLLELEK
jgi:3-oxoacyl-[acyl-carrier-protein] synthase-3